MRASIICSLHLQHCMFCRPGHRKLALGKLEKSIWQQTRTTQLHGPSMDGPNLPLDPNISCWLNYRTSRPNLLGSIAYASEYRCYERNRRGYIQSSQKESHTNTTNPSILSPLQATFIIITPRLINYPLITGLAED